MNERDGNLIVKNENYKDVFPIIKTNRLVCRQITNEDAQILHQYWSDPDVTKYFSLEPFKTMKETLGMIELLNSMPENNQG